MPFSPFPLIKIIQTEINNRVTRRDEEDRLHAELRGEEYDFIFEADGESREAILSIENIAKHEEGLVKIGLRLRGYECPSALEDWEEDIIYLYITQYLRGSGSAKELGNPLLSELTIGGFSPHDIRISMYVHTTYQSRILDAVRRIAETITLYHSNWFQQMKELHEEKGEQFREDPDSLDLGDGVLLVEAAEDQNLLQAYSSLADYFKYKLDEETEDDSRIEYGSSSPFSEI